MMGHKICLHEEIWIKYCTYKYILVTGLPFSLWNLVCINVFYSTISYIYTYTIYIINRIRTEVSAYFVLLLMDTVSQIMAAKTVCYCC